MGQWANINKYKNKYSIIIHFRRFNADQNFIIALLNGLLDAPDMILDNC